MTQIVVSLNEKIEIDRPMTGLSNWGQAFVFNKNGYSRVGLQIW